MARHRRTSPGGGERVEPRVPAPSCETTGAAEAALVDGGHGRDTASRRHPHPLGGTRGACAAVVKAVRST
jgi:hypothetical protein